MFSTSRGTARAARLKYAVPAGLASLSLLLAACGGDSAGGEAAGAERIQAVCEIGRHRGRMGEQRDALAFQWRTQRGIGE